jgi:hypothetical protein
MWRLLSHEEVVACELAHGGSLNEKQQRSPEKNLLGFFSS